MLRVAEIIALLVSMVTIGALLYSNYELKNTLSYKEYQLSTFLKQSKELEKLGEELKQGENIINQNGTLIEKFNNLNNHLNSNP